MPDRPSIEVAEFGGKQLETASPDLLREVVKMFAEALRGADADNVCNAGYGERTGERTNSRTGYRDRPWDTRAGSIELRVPKLRTGSYFPDWLRGRRTRAEQALISVVATAYLLGVSTRRVEGPVQTLGIDKLSRSQVSEMAKQGRHPVLGVPIPSAFVLTHEDGRDIDVHVYEALGARVNCLWDTDRAPEAKDLAAVGSIRGVPCAA